ncbi:MAG: hypothetical protein LAO08_03495 [Acidobacteriia bacterium]|nr:hypothetical protein [Terriglobia bacterium]
MLSRLLIVVFHVMETVFLTWITIVMTGLLGFCMREVHDLSSTVTALQAFGLKLTGWLWDMPPWKSAAAIGAGILYFLLAGSQVVQMAHFIHAGF